MMFSHAVSLRRLATPVASSVLRSSPFSTTAKQEAKKAAVLAAALEAAAATAPQQVARDRPFLLHIDPAKVKRPPEIPFELQVANTVHLVGTVGGLPVLEEKSPGEHQAVSVIIEKKDSVENDLLQLRIPVIFQGDLALIAACHLKENDLVYIVGRLSGDDATTTHNKIRIFARSLSFVESNNRKDDKMVTEQAKKLASRKDDKMVSEHDKKMASRKDEKMVSEQDKKMASDHPDSTSKSIYDGNDGKKTLPLNKEKDDSTSRSIYDVNDGKKTLPPNKEKDGNVKDESWWMDAFSNPGNWKDNRINKQIGTVNPRYPDFTHKSSGQPLWLASSPGWVQSKLDDLNFFETSDSSPDFTSNDVNDGKKTILLNKKKDEDLWKDVIENPTKWWDNRLNKLKPTSYDFKHKDSGVALWLGDSPPSWVLEKLPPAENSEDLWKDVIENPTKWWDSRLNKRNPRAPDFRHKDSGVVLWLSDSLPSWVLEKLPPAVNPEDLWKDVIENPTKWWDGRLNKLNPRSPDFKHKDSGVGLWLSNSPPSWVLEKLPPTESPTNSDRWAKAAILS